MEMNVLISNIINCVGSALNMIGVNLKEKQKTLILFIFGNICVAIALGILNAIVGMIIQLIFVIETLINYFWDKKHNKYPLWMIILYVAIPCIALAFTFKNAWDILPLISGIVFPLSLLTKDFKLRFLNLISAIAWIPYNFHFQQYVGTISCILLTCMTIVAIVRLDILKQKVKN